MTNIEFLKECGFFEKEELKQGEVLFDEGEENNKLYIVYNGEIIVEKKNKGDDAYKTLSLLKSGAILGERSLLEKQKKSVRVSAKSISTILSIESDNFSKFVSLHPDKSYELLMQIIATANDRLLQANEEITANFEISQRIANIKDFDIKTIIEILEYIKTVLDAQQIIYLEKNMVMNEYFKVKYNSGSKKSFESTILKFPGGRYDEKILESEIQPLHVHKLSAALKLGSEVHGYIVVTHNQKVFSENQEKLLKNSAISFSGVIHQKEILESERNKKYIKNY